MSASTDFYALGCVVFEMLAGAPPFGGPDYMAQHLGEPVPAVTELCPRLPEVFDAAIAKLMAKAQDDRPQDATEARALLSALWIAIGIASLVSFLLAMLLLEWAPVAELGEGGIERWIVYPAILWLTTFGGALMGTGATSAEQG